MVLALEPFERRHQLLLAGALLAMGRIGRLGLAGLVGVEEGEQRPAAGAKAARQAVALVDHGGDLRVLDRRREVARAHRGEAVHQIDQHQAGARLPELQALRSDRQFLPKPRRERRKRQVIEHGQHLSPQACRKPATPASSAHRNLIPSFPFGGGPLPF